MCLFFTKAKSKKQSNGLAAQVQQMLLPKTPPVCDWSCIGVRNRMAQGLGGDFYDFLPTADGCQAIMIGDVIGHGPSAAVVMGTLFGYIHSKLEQVCSPHQVVDQVNGYLKHCAGRSQIHDHHFSATMFFGIVDPMGLKMEYINAGHPPPLVRRGGEILTLAATTQPLGFFEVQEGAVRTVQFEKHDRWLLYTDGITETTDGNGELFGQQRVETLLLNHQGDHLEFLDALLEEIMAFDGQPEPRDDCTAIAIDFYRGQGG